MIDSELIIRLRKYAVNKGLEIEFTRRIGSGNDGIVWRTTDQTAVKVF